jgi:transcription-repair coupling factor (superfamily II helicase)
MIERFGEPPAPVDRMLDLAQLRLDATIWQISAIRVEGRDLIFEYTARPRVELLARQSQGRLRVVDDKHAYFRIRHENPSPEYWLIAAKSVLRPK